MSLSSRFWGAVERLLAGGLHAEDEIITLAEMDNPVSVTAVHDCTESLLNALLSGLKKYGTSLIDGHYFFRTLSLLSVPASNGRIGVCIWRCVVPAAGITDWNEVREEQQRRDADCTIRV
jgi:hypothetical protein